MKKLLLAATPFALLAACDGYGASSGSISGGTELTYSEFQSTYPGSSRATAVQVDSDADGRITENEVQAARDDGIL